MQAADYTTTDNLHYQPHINPGLQVSQRDPHTFNYYYASVWLSNRIHCFIY